jgi:two-component system chemotaxis response regulator CheY
LLTATPETDHQAIVPDPNGKRLKILVVDDDPFTLQIIQKRLAKEHYPVLTATNGVEALAVLAQSWIDIVFADLNMPEMGGAELVHKMSQDNLLVSIPVVIVSSERNQERIDELKRLGIRAYLRKPFRPEGFRDVVRDVLGQGGES